MCDSSNLKTLWWFSLWWACLTAKVFYHCYVFNHSSNILAKTAQLETQRAHSPGLFNIMYGALSSTVKFGSQVVQKTAGSISPRALITST